MGIWTDELEVRSMYCWEGGGWRDDGITMDGYMNCKGGLRDEWMRGQMGGQMIDGWMNGWMISSCFSSCPRARIALCCTR